MNDHTVASRIIHPEQRKQADDETFASLRELAGCEADMHMPEARRLLATPSGSPEAAAALKVMFGHQTSCLRFAIQMRMNDRLFRAALAEALYRLDRKQMPVPTPLAPTASEEVLRPERDTADAALATFSLCVADADPMGVEKVLFTTRLGTVASDQALGGLSQQFSACLAADSTVRLQALVVRMGLAQAMYHRLWAGREAAIAHLAQTN